MPVPSCLCGHESTSLTQMKRHRKTCSVWQARDRGAIQGARTKATSLSRYGIPAANWTPEVRARREATNIARYGSANPMHNSEVAARALENGGGPPPPSHGSANSFAKPEVQAKIRATLQAKYGVANPQQVPEIRAATRATNLVRHGTEEPLSAPAIRARIRATCEAQYGGPAPSCSPEVRAKQQVTNTGHYGVPWTSMDPGVRQKQLAAMEAKYGAHFFASDEGKATVRAILKERYGVDFPGAIEGHWERAVEAFRDRFGVDHPLQLEEFREKARQTCRERYGTPFPGLCTAGPNLLERKIAGWAPVLLWTGDGKFWKRLPLLDAYKNPDFILPGPDPKHPKRGVAKVVEVFGDFWHSLMRTGKAPFDHERELVSAYTDIGIACLVLWESEIKRHPVEVAARLTSFLGGTP